MKIRSLILLAVIFLSLADASAYEVTLKRGQTWTDCAGDKIVLKSVGRTSCSLEVNSIPHILSEDNNVTTNTSNVSVSEINGISYASLEIDGTSVEINESDRKEVGLYDKVILESVHSLEAACTINFNREIKKVALGDTEEIGGADVKVVSIFDYNDHNVKLDIDYGTKIMEGESVGSVLLKSVNLDSVEVVVDNSLPRTISECTTANVQGKNIKADVITYDNNPEKRSAVLVVSGTHIEQVVTHAVKPLNSSGAVSVVIAVLFAVMIGSYLYNRRNS